MIPDRTFHAHERKLARSTIFERGLGAMLETALLHVKTAREEEAAEHAKYVVRQPLCDRPSWVPIRRTRQVMPRTRGNPWRDARRAREHERLVLLGEEG